MACFSPHFWGVSNEMLQDYEAWLNLLLEGPFLYAPSSYVSYRLHDANLSGGVVSTAQHHYERMSLLNRIFLSERFLDFYSALEDSARLDFLFRLDAALLSLAQRVEGIPYLHGQLLDRLYRVETSHKGHLVTLRAAMALRLGMGRKYNQLRQFAHLPDTRLDAALPPITPHGAIQQHDAITRLTQAGIGRKTDQWQANKGFLLLSATEWPAKASDPVVSEAAQQQRLLLWGSDTTGPLEEGYAFKADAVLDNQQCMKFWRYTENADLLGAAHPTHSSAPLWLQYGRSLYRRTGRFLPQAVQRRLIRIVHYLIDKK